MNIKKLGVGLALLLLIRSAGAWPATDLTPPMGWEPWNINHCSEATNAWDETYHKKLADFFVSSGLRDLGYTYITFECNAHYRDAEDRFLPDLKKFPGGFRPINDYLHQRGLKARAYTDAGIGKCGGDVCFKGPGSFGHYESDAKTWAEAGFDGVKIDWCGGAHEKLNPEKQFREFFAAMTNHNPGFNIEICTWGQGKPWEWGRFAGTFWRTCWDIDMDMQSRPVKVEWGGSWKSLLRNIDANRHADPQLVGPGKGWNYPDMLVVGMPGGLNEVEERTQFTMWAIMASPLFLGNDVLNMPAYVKEIVMNREVIAVDQDALGVQGDVVTEADDGQAQIWMKPLKDGSKAVVLFNRGETARKITADWKAIGFDGECRIRDLWEHADKGNFPGSYSPEVPPHAAAMLEISPVKPVSSEAVISHK